ncbi:MAG TPA: lysophospholipid acyltransferase family protein, partial [Coxiellaceae bacterium]|nr:lysophospholipid acyltransferase family protein [Coxiellaceae bacterium]
MRSTTALKKYIAGLKLTLSGKLLCGFLSSSTKVAMKNMEIAFGENLTADERKKLTQAFAGHIVKTVFEILSARFLSKKQIIDRVEVKGREHAKAALNKQRGVLLLTAHLGNWEFAPLGAALQLTDIFSQGFHIVRKKVPNPQLEKFLFKHFEEAGIHILAKENSLRPIFRVLAQNGAVIITFDQYVKPGARG